jgi:hypothetical protein
MQPSPSSYLTRHTSLSQLLLSSFIGSSYYPPSKVRWPSGLRRQLKEIFTSVQNLLIAGPKGRGFKSHSDHYLLRAVGMEWGGLGTVGWRMEE